MKKYITLLLIIGLTCLGCKKFLDEKPRQSLTVPETLTDFQALLEKELESEQDPKWGEVSTDDFYYEDAILAAKEQVERNAYQWDKGNVFGTDVDMEWFYDYRFVYHTNTVLEGLEKVERTASNQAQWDRIKGEALFFRAKCHLSIVNIWARGYDAATAQTDPGIPLRLNTDFNEVSVRGTLAETYGQIIKDLTTSIDLLPVIPSHVVRPSRPAALGLLSRVNLFMRNYDECIKYADACLQLKNDLLDYNTLTTTAAFPIPAFNKEVIYHSNFSTALPNSRINLDLYKMFGTSDLRKKIFFKDNGNGTYSFKGSYWGASKLFAGLAVDEVYLMRAECYARKGDITAALADLNTLMKSRSDKSAFVPYTATDAKAALNLILIERRKELLLRGIRWPDVKRLNNGGELISLKRTINGTDYILLPNDPRFALPIPQPIIDLTGMIQNSR
ncbi:MAG: RagB/SusD family nutrient uptake outer membrane protein [Mucilaginibacter sp.]|uniref:RagB/SusD family nutrient uptake outer membrane protein n=1 Tax=Mucilaginibacter sp. TaxID=1882438 RepID=UPI0032634478